MTGAIDVITVPDFTGSAAARFELRTLLFLGSWMLHEGASRSWPLHLVCIGSPPATVQRLAERAGASITVRGSLPAPYPGTSHKLLGLEITPTAGRFLLLDTDTVVLGDLEPMARAVGDAVGVGPATANHIDDGDWQRIYTCVGAPYPGPTGTCWQAQWDLSRHRPAPPELMARCLRMPPYHNSGVVMAPWRIGLGAVWRKHLDLILKEFSSELASRDPIWIRRTDQFSLATAIETLRLSGARVETLPLAYQVRPPLLLSEILIWPDVALFHYVNVFRDYAESVAEVRGLLYGTRLQAMRRRLAGAAGLRAIRSPVFRRVQPDRLRAYKSFFEYVHRVFDACAL